MREPGEKGWRSIQLYSKKALKRGNQEHDSPAPKIIGLAYFIRIQEGGKRIIRKGRTPDLNLAWKKVPGTRLTSNGIGAQRI